MAIDPRIALEARAPDISGVVSTFQNALLNAQAGRQNEQMLQQANVMNPLLAQQAQQGVDINTQNIAAARNESRFKNIYQTSQMLKPFIANNDAAGAEQFMLKNISRLQDAKARGEDVDLTESLETLEQIKAGNLQGVSQNIAAIEGIAQQRMNKGMSAGQREFNQLAALAGGDKNLDITQAARIKLGLAPRASTSTELKILEDPTGLGQAQVDQASSVAKATEGSKLESKLKWQPEITKAVKLAEKAAIERGDVLNDLDRMTAALPGVRDAVSQLRELAPLTTTTWGGKVWDTAVKQTGFGATKGSTAAAKFQSIVDNQVLPLLKPTFGAAFTVQEGESLKATLGDVNASAEEKMATLDAFLNQKERDIQTKQTQTNQTFNFDAQGNLIQ